MNKVGMILATMVLSLGSSGSAVALEQAAPAGSAAADQLVELTIPTETLVSIGLRGFDVGFDAEAAKPEMLKMESTYPGIIAAIRSDARAAVESGMRRTVPQSRKAISTFYQSRFTPDELTSLAAFYASPVGRKMLSGALAGSTTSVLKDVQAGKKNLDMGATVSAGQLGALQSLTAEDMPAVSAFGLTPAAQKAARLAPELQQFVATQMQSAMASLSGDVAQASKAAAARFIATHKPKRPA